jgi:hypothetical protein
MTQTKSRRSSGVHPWLPPENKTNDKRRPETMRPKEDRMNWKTDPPTVKQLRFLKRLGCSAVPRTKGEACDLIAARAPRPRTPDPVEIVDQAAERVKQQLRAEGDRCNQRILCGVITWRRGLSGIHRNDAGCRDGEITRCGEGEVLAGGDSAAGSQWTGNEAVLCPGRDSRTSALLVATNAASARSAPSPSVAGRRGGGLGP